MEHAQPLVLYIVSLVIFLALDTLWLGLIANKLYKKSIGHLLSEKVQWRAAAAYYLLFMIGLIVFCVLPGIRAHSLIQTLMLSLLYGLTTYASYDLTNLTTLKNWPVKITIIDIIWGMVISSTTSCSVYLVFVD
jgi:uncharacterized membrane protein